MRHDGITYFAIESGFMSYQLRQTLLCTREDYLQALTVFLVTRVLAATGAALQGLRPLEARLADDNAYVSAVIMPSARGGLDVLLELGLESPFEVMRLSFLAAHLRSDNSWAIDAILVNRCPSDLAGFMAQLLRVHDLPLQSLSVSDDEGELLSYDLSLFAPTLALNSEQAHG